MTNRQKFEQQLKDEYLSEYERVNGEPVPGGIAWHNGVILFGDNTLWTFGKFEASLNQLKKQPTYSRWVALQKYIRKTLNQ